MTPPAKCWGCSSFSFLMWIFLPWLFFFHFENITLLHFFLPIQTLLLKHADKDASEGGSLEMGYGCYLSLCSLTMAISHFTAPQLPPKLVTSNSMSSFISLDSRPFCATAYWTFPPGCPTGTSNSTSKLHSHLPSQTCSTYVSSQQMTPPSAWLPKSSSKF